MQGMGTEAKWEARVDGWRRSGLSATAYSKGKDFTAGGLRYWASRLGRVEHERGGKGPVRLARLVRTDAGADLDTPIVLEVGGVRVGVRRGFDRDTLRSLLEIVGGVGAAQ
jgi:hypothetical protein